LAAVSATCVILLPLVAVAAVAVTVKLFSCFILLLLAFVVAGLLLGFYGVILSWMLGLFYSGAFNFVPKCI
jgi:hypothetical protein